MHVIYIIIIVMVVVIIVIIVIIVIMFNIINIIIEKALSITRLISMSPRPLSPHDWHFQKHFEQFYQFLHHVTISVSFASSSA